MSESTNEKQPGLTIITRPPPAAKDIRAHVLSTIEDVDSQYTMTPTTTHQLNSVGDHEASPLYLNPSTTPSLDNSLSRPSNVGSESKQAMVYESDIEACLYKKDVKVVKTHHDGKMWPGRRTLMQRYKRDKRQRQSCNPMKNLDKRTKIIIKVLIILVVVGGAIALGIGISKAVGGGVWKTNNSSSTISR